MRNQNPRNIALGGILAAACMVIMLLGGLIPIATYVCPVLCTLVCAVVLRQCGRGITWAWYGCVAVLSALMAPDKEAAAVFAFLGYYPLIKGVFDRLKAGWILKAVFFNCATAVLYFALIFLLGMEQLASEYMEFGLVGLMLILVLGNATFFLLDRLLGRIAGKA